jgi:small GTP-binding protein
MLGEMDDAAQEDSRQLMESAQDLRDMFFLVVVIGEFNAGKSTFVNALLGDDLLPIGITPTTEIIELVRYNETPVRKPEMKGDSLREWAHPDTGAPGVAIVDTPGTGSVFQKHEQTAKAFLHRSDLVIFVLSAKRAFAETERLYLEMARNFGKKIILVVNQADLLQPAEQTQVRRFIEQQVKDHLGIQPLLFMVSAKEARAARESGQTQGDPGGIGAVRAHLRGVFDEIPPAQQKLLAQLETADRVVKRHHEAVKNRASLISADAARAREVQQELREQTGSLATQLSNARAEVDAVFEGIRKRGLNFIDTHLSIRRVLRSESKETLQAEFQDVVIGRAVRDVSEATSGYVNALVDNSRLYWRSVIERLNRLQELLDQEVGGLDAGVYAEQREGLQDAIRIAEGELKTYSSGQIVDDIQREFDTNMNGFRTGSLALIGGLVTTILALAAPGPVLGAGAAITASLAFVVAVPVTALGGLYTLRYYRRITSETRRDFNARVDRLMATYHETLEDLTRKESERLARYGDQVLAPMFSRMEVLAKRYAEQQERLEAFEGRISALRQRIEKSG